MAGKLRNNNHYFVEVCFATIFSVARMVGGPYLVYVTIPADNPILIKVYSILIYEYDLHFVLGYTYYCFINCS